jgi:lysophospholipase L1-like esterase
MSPVFCTKRNVSGYNPKLTLRKDLGEEDMRTIRYLALGDSYTIGESVPAEERWPKRLAMLLRAEGIQTEVRIIARTGWTVAELWQGIQADPPTRTYDLVTLLIGVNDQYRGYPVDGYRKDFRSMLGKAIEYAGGNPNKVIVLSIPDWGVTPFAADRDRQQITKQIDHFNVVNREESQKAGVHYVDVTSISREAVSDAALITSDGLHPSGKMYAMWAEEVLPVVREMLK